MALTFDDGFASFAAEAWPRLRDHGLPATLFVVTGRAGADNRWGGRAERGIPVLRLLGWEELGRLASEGLELGLHGRTHAALAGLGAAALADEVGGARVELERRCGVRARSFAYPYGRFDDPAVGAVRGAVERAVTTELRPLGAAEDPCLLPRIDAYYLRRPDGLEGWGRPAFRRRLAWIATRRRLRAIFTAWR